MIRKPTWIVLIVFAILAAGAFLWQRNEAEKEPEPLLLNSSEEAPGMLFENRDRLVGMRIERVDDRVVEFHTDANGNWQVTWPQGQETDSDMAGQTIALITNVSLVAAVKDAVALEDLQLKPPVYRIEVSMSDGTTWRASIGKSTPTGSGYYVLTSDRRLVIASKYALDAILGLVDNLPLKPTPTATIPAEPTLEPALQTTPTP
jgi:hypothetical protein